MMIFAFSPNISCGGGAAKALGPSFLILVLSVVVEIVPIYLRRKIVLWV